MPRPALHAVPVGDLQQMFDRKTAPEVTYARQVEPARPRKVVSYSAPKQSAGTVGERLYPDLGGDDFVRAVLRVGQSQPRMSISQETELGDILRTQAAGYQVNEARLHELQRVSRRSSEAQSIATEISSALSAGDRKHLAAALRRAPGGSVLANRLER